MNLADVVQPNWLARFHEGHAMQSSPSSLSYNYQHKIHHEEKRRPMAPVLGLGLGLGAALYLPRISISTRRTSLSIRAEVVFVNGDEAKKLVNEQGYKILDVRDKTQFERAHIKSCYHVPLFIENDDNDLGTVIKRTVHNNFSGLFFGLPFTKKNPDFIKSVKEQLSPDNKLLVVCQEGLRSTAAASELERQGYQNLACIVSGLQSLQPGTFESVGKTEVENAGKAGLVSVQGKISAVLGTVLICAYLFITFFPDQAEKLLPK